MRVSIKSLGAVALLSSSAVAQSSSVISYATSILGQLSPSCQQVALSLVTPSSGLFQCLQVSSLAPHMSSLAPRTARIDNLPVLTSNTSIVPTLDSYVSSICSSSPCSNATLTNVTQMITTGCASDLAKYNISSSFVSQVAGVYPLAREVMCLKTTKPFNATNATIPTNSSSYNTTNGTFCTTNLLTELSTYLGANLTIPYITNAVVSMNSSALNLITKIPATMLCQDCIFAGLDLIEEEFPSVGRISVGQNMTVNSYLNGSCNATGLVVSTNGTLPSTIREVASNSTFGYNITVGNVTIAPANGSMPGPKSFNLTIRGEPAMKKRWFGKN